MEKEKYNELILKLMMATMSGAITWRKTSSENGFQVKIGKNSVTIVCCDSMKLASLVENHECDVQSATLSIINSKGECIDNYNRSNGHQGFEQLRQLFVTIRKKINKVDETLDEILKDL